MTAITICGAKWCWDNWLSIVGGNSRWFKNQNIFKAFKQQEKWKNVFYKS